MAKPEPTYRIDPIEPGEVGPRLGALVDSLEPVLAPGDVVEIRALVAAGAFGPAFDRLDAATNVVTAPIATATLVELVLVGQAVRSPGD